MPQLTLSLPTLPVALTTNFDFAAPAIPLTGSWAVGIEGQLKRKASKPDNTQIDVSYPFHNDVAYFAVTDPTAVPRRAAVATANCNRCHSDLGAHGGSSNDAAYCVLCHGANADTSIPAFAGYLLNIRKVLFIFERVYYRMDEISDLVAGTPDEKRAIRPGQTKWSSPEIVAIASNATLQVVSTYPCRRSCPRT